MAMAKNTKSSEPRLAFHGSKEVVRYRNRKSILKQPKENPMVSERSSVDSTAGRGSYIYTDKSDFTFKVSP